MADSFHAWCAADRDALLEKASHYYQAHYARPSQGVRHCCALQGFRVACADIDVGPDEFGDIDWETGWIYLPADRPDHQAEALAHALGHIRLHELELRAGRCTAQQLEEARIYAHIFLVPRQRFLRTAAEALQDPALAGRASRDWGVSPNLILLRAREVAMLPLAIEMQLDDPGQLLKVRRQR